MTIRISSNTDLLHYKSEFIYQPAPYQANHPPSAKKEYSSQNAKEKNLLSDKEQNNWLFFKQRKNIHSNPAILTDTTANTVTKNKLIPSLLQLGPTFLQKTALAPFKSISKRSVPLETNPPPNPTTPHTAIQNAFIAFIKKTDATVDDLPSAFRKYINHYKNSATNTSRPTRFTRELLVSPEFNQNSSLPEESSLETKSRLLAAALLADIDFSSTADNSISYNQYIFSKLNHQPIGEAKRLIEQFITNKIKNHFHISEDVACHLSDLFLPTVAPELAAIKTADPALQGVNYGDAKWGNLVAGTYTALSLEHDPCDYSANDLMQMGQATLASHFDEHGADRNADIDELSLNEHILLLRANANGVLNLNKAADHQQQFSEETFIEFIKKEYPNEIKASISQHVLESPIPTRREIAKRILQNAQYDPDALATEKNYMMLGIGGTTIPTQKSLLDLYMDSHVSTLPFSVREQPEAIEKLPDLNQEFNTQFDNYGEETATAISDLITAQLNGLLKKENWQEAQFSLVIGGIRHVKGMSIPGLRTLREFVEKYDQLTFIEVTHSQGIQRFLFDCTAPAKGLQKLPDGQTISAWMQENKKEGKDSYLLDPIVTSIQQQNGWSETIASENLMNIGNQIKDRYLNHYLPALKTAAYDVTSFESTMETAREIALPFVGAVTAFNKGNYGQGALSLGLDVISYFPLLKILRLGKLTRIATRLASNRAAAAMDYLKEGVRHFASAAIRRSPSLQNGITKISNITAKIREPIRAIDAAAKGISNIAQQNLDKIRSLVNVHPELTSYMLYPSGNCENALYPLQKLLQEEGYNTQIRGVQFWSNALIDTPDNHYLVIAQKGGETYAIDITAAQFSRYGIDTPLFLPESQWASHYQTKLTQTLTKYKDFPTILEARKTFGPLSPRVPGSPELGVRTPHDHIPGAYILSQARWANYPLVLQAGGTR